MNLPAIAALISLILVFLLTVPTFWSLFNKARSKAKWHTYEDVYKLYEDRDGLATGSHNQYSIAIPKYTALSTSIIGCLASVTITAYTSRHPAYSLYLDGWFLFGTWVPTFSSQDAQESY